jgi:hypothetical protein
MKLGPGTGPICAFIAKTAAGAPRLVVISRGWGIFDSQGFELSPITFEAVVYKPPMGDYAWTLLWRGDLATLDGEPAPSDQRFRVIGASMLDRYPSSAEIEVQMTNGRSRFRVHLKSDDRVECELVEETKELEGNGS